MAKWRQERMLGQVKTEQIIDAWVKQDAKGTVIQGKLDVAWQEGKKEHTLDVSVAVSYTHLRAHETR
eukprot:9616463-Prorocentrum_lima.AAC.1